MLYALVKVKDCKVAIPHWLKEMTHKVGGPTWLKIVGPTLLNHRLDLRAIPLVSGSQVSLTSGTAFSKHRQTIYQNAQNFILIIV